MSTIETSLLHRPQPIVTDLPVWRFTVEEYRRMSENGTLAGDNTVELLEGLVVPKMPKNPPHILVCKLLRRCLERLLGEGWHVATQNPLATEDSEPEPDLTVLRGREEDYGDRLPTSADCPLVIEVADSTLKRDRGIKSRIYARTGVQQYWIASIPDQQIEVFSDPSGPAETPTFGQSQQYGIGDAIPVIVDGHHYGDIPVSSLFPVKDSP